MSEPLLDLLQTLREETDSYRTLARLAAEQKGILVSSKLEGLQENVRKQEKVMFGLGPLADNRQRQLDEVARSLGLKKPKVSEVAGRLPEAEGKLLLTAANDLMAAAHGLEAVNHVNGKLLENAQAYAKFTVEAFRGKAAERSTAPAHKPIDRGTSSFNQVI